MIPIRVLSDRGMVGVLWNECHDILTRFNDLLQRCSISSLF